MRQTSEDKLDGQVKIGVIGLGRMGQHHCRVYSNQKDARLVGVYDIDTHTTKDTAEKYEVEGYSRLEDLLDQVDALTIATPTPTHYAIASQCLERRIHVLLEKPVTDNIKDAEALTSLADNCGSVCLIGHIERFNPAYVELKKVLDRSSVIAINFRRLSPYRVSNTDVDVVLDLMVHDLDLAYDITGRDPEFTYANGLMPFSSSLDHVVAQLFFANGPLVTLTASRVTEQKIRSVDVTCEDCFIEVDFMNKSISIHRGSTGEFLGKTRNGVSYHQESIIERILVPNTEPLSAEIRSFLECIKQNRPPRVSIHDGLKALRMAQNISMLASEQLNQFSINSLLPDRVAAH
ncbi:MAG: Gfo/Idh/MocA family oxidoreductase [Anaerolineae bacterium]|nr:Gfo/Idh/MocA family oxidoreductase [Anaerolineae bacterium]